MRLMLSIVLCVLGSLAFADVYKCVNEDGEISFKDTPCPASAAQEILDYCWLSNTKKDTRTFQARYICQQAALNRVKIQKLRKQRDVKKEQERQEARRLRLALRCESVKKQIAHLNSRLKQGYTLKQGISINNKIAELTIKKQKYCKK